jgi:DNA-directed RNA polymerase subunit RPC12/RpoP
MAHKYVDCPECTMRLGRPGTHHNCDKSKVIEKLEAKIRVLEGERKRGQCAWCGALVYTGRDDLLAHARACPKNGHRQMIHALAIAAHVDGVRDFCRLCLRSWRRNNFEDHAPGCEASAGWKSELAVAE